MYDILRKGDNKQGCCLFGFDTRCPKWAIMRCEEDKILESHHRNYISYLIIYLSNIYKINNCCIIRECPRILLNRIFKTLCLKLIFLAIFGKNIIDVIFFNVSQCHQGPGANSKAQVKTCCNIGKQHTNMLFGWDNMCRSHTKNVRWIHKFTYFNAIQRVCHHCLGHG